MGSFNTKCFVTQQTIAPNDPCILYLVRQQASFEPIDVSLKGAAASLYGPFLSSTEPAALWAPVASSLEAVYEDRQAYKVLDSAANRRALSTWLAYLWTYGATSPAIAQAELRRAEDGFDPRALIKELAPEVAMRYLESGPDAFMVPFQLESTEDFDGACQVFEALASEICRGRVFGGSFLNDGARPLQFSAMHTATHGSLVGLAQLPDLAVRKRMRPEERIAVSLKDALALRRSAQADSEQMKTFFSVSMALEDLMPRAVRGMGPQGGHAWLHQTLSAFVEEKLTEQEVAEALMPVVREAYVHEALSSLFVLFTPSLYVTQDYDNTVGRVYAGLVNEVSQTVCAQRERELD